MKVLSYKYILPNEEGIVESLSRKEYMTSQYISITQEYISSIKLNGKVAILYAGGVLLGASEARNVVDSGKLRENVLDSGACIRETAAYSMHRWIGMINGRDNIRYASINGNTCASSMYSLYEAERLLDDEFDEVVIIAEEKTSYNTLRIFDEMNIDLKVGEGCAVIHLGKGEGISECKWEYEYNRNPFGVTKSGYKRVMNDCDYVNPHGTGTETNETAESFYYKPQLRYKEKIGHTQGVSGLIEVCMVLDEPDIQGRVLCVSSGMGNWYGSCVVLK